MVGWVEVVENVDYPIDFPIERDFAMLNFVVLRMTVKGSR
jgi:hypothetical protein